jgi:Leucine-rich repeat (LRR) protein
MLEDSIQQDTLFEDEREGSDQETVDEALTCISEEDSKHFQGEPDHEGSWRRRDHFTVKAAAKPTLGTLGVTEEVDSETESTEFFGHQQTLGNRGQASATSSEDDFYQGEYGSSSTSGSDDSSGEDADEDEEMEMLENVDAYMEAASATPSKRSATDDKSSAGSKRAKEQGHVEPQQEEKQQPEAKIQISPASKRSSYKDFRDAYSAGDADALETSSSLKKFRELYDQDDAIPEDDETLTTLRSMEKEMESISAAGSTDDAIAAKKEALKKSINTALRDLEKIHGEEAAQAIFLRLTQNLDGIDTETLSKELSGSGIDKGSPSSANSALSDNENLENTEPAISPIEPSATSTGTLRTVSTSEAETENNSMSSTSKDGRASGIPRYMQYRNSLLSPDKSSKASSQSSSQVSEVVTPDNDPSSSTSESIAPRPTSIPRYMQYRSSLAKDLSSGSGSDGIEAKGFDADTAAGVPMATKDDKEDTNRTVKSTEMPRYMQYRDSLRKNSSLSTMAADTTVVKARPSETTSASAPFLGDVEVVPTISKDDQTTASIRHDTKTADSQSPFVPRFMQYRTAFNRETDNAFPSSEKTESVDPSRAATLSTNAGRVPSASAVIEFGTSTSNITTEDGTDVVAPVASMSPTVSDTAPDSTNQPDTSSMPRYTQYRNRLAKRTSPGSGTDDAVGEDGGGSDKSRTGIVAAAAVASVGAAAVTAGVMSSTNDGKSGPTASTLPRYMQYRTTLSKNTASLPGAGTEPSASRSEVTPPPSASVSNMSGMGPSSTPRYLQYRETLSNSTVAKEAVAEKSVAATVKSISPTDSGTTPDFINQTDTSSMPRYMKYRNTLAKKNDPTSGTDDAVGKNEGGFANNRTGVVAAAAVASIGAAAAMSSTNDGNSEPTASTSPQYMQYRSALATGTGSKAPASTTDLEDPSMSESDNSMESQPDISVPDDLANRNSRHLADSESSSEEDLDQDISAANDDVPVAVISSTANSVRSEAAEPDMQTSAQVIVGPGPSTSTDEGLTIQELNRRRIAATIARVTAQSGVSLGPKASLNDAPPKQDLKQQPIAPEVSTATTHENVEPSPNASSVEPPPIQDLNRQRIAATISRAMSQNKGEKRPSIMEKRPKQNKTNPLQEQAHEVGDKQVEVAGPILAASPPPPAIPDSAAALSATLPPQPGSSGPTELAGSNDNARKSQLMHHPAPRKRRQSFLYALLILFLVAAPLSIGLAVSQRNKDAPSPPALGTDSPTSAPSPLLRSRAPATTPPTPLDPNPSPVASPSSDPPTDLSPVASPTPGIASPTRVPERAELFDLLSSVSSDGGVNIATPGTPQYDAFNWLANDPNVTTLPGEKLIQRYSLATFYYSTNGGNWTSSQGWLTEEDECAWFTRSTRIPVCDDGGVFQNLDLGFNEVGGSIPAELALLSNLLRVGLSGGTTQRISGPLPVELGSLTNLVTFDVFGNALTGSIPPELGAWTDVELMNMGFNRLSGSLPNTFQSMTSLMELDCGLNFLTGSIPSTLSNLASLEKLILNNNELNGAVQVSGLSELRELNVEGNAFTSVGSSLGNLSNLQTLRLNNNALTGPILGNIGNLTNLITLDMSRNGLSGAIPTQIGMLTNLRNLHLSSNSLEGTIPTQIGMLNGLLNLLLQSNKLTGSIPDEISQLKRLTTIRLEENIIQGSVSTTVCDAFTTTRPIFYLDCGGDSPEVTCPPGSECCTFCCTTEGGCQCELEGTSSEFLCG